MKKILRLVGGFYYLSISNRIIFVSIFFLASIFLPFVLDVFEFSSWGDVDWYYSAGKFLLNGSTNPEYILFSPLHSVMTFLKVEYLGGLWNANPLYHLHVVVMSIVLYEYTLLLVRLNIIKSKFCHSIVLSLFLLDPFIYKFSTGIHPEYFMIILGFLISGMLLKYDSSCKHKIFTNSTLSMSSTNFTENKNTVSPNESNHMLFPANRRFWIVKHTDFREISILVVLSFLAILTRYTSLFYFAAFFVLVSSPIVLDFCHSVFGFKCCKSDWYYFPLIGTFVILVSLLGVFLFNLFFSTLSGFHDFSSCKIVERILMLIGFREGFFADNSTCFYGFSRELFLSRFSGDLSAFNYMVSMIFGIIRAFGSCMCIYGIFKFSGGMFKQYALILLTMLVVVSIIIGVSHYRYFLVFFPFLVVGNVVVIQKYS